MLERIGIMGSTQGVNEIKIPNPKNPSKRAQVLLPESNFEIGFSEHLPKG
jgi:hypothetical protein